MLLSPFSFYFSRQYQCVRAGLVNVDEIVQMPNFPPGSAAVVPG